MAFIGAGTVSQMHARGVSACENAELIGVYDTKKAKAEALTEKFGGRVYRTTDELISDPRIEAVHVLTPQDYHIDAALASLKSKKHVLVEKPVAWQVSEIRKLEQAAREADRVCMPAHNYIYNSNLQRAKRLIETGKLGTIAGFWMIYNMFHSEEVAAAYGGVVRVVCVHHAYSLLYLLGRPKQVTATVSSLHYTRLTCEDQAAIVCQMPSGAIANLWSSMAADDPTSDPWTVIWKVLGTRGGLVFSWNEAHIDDHSAPGFNLPCYEDSFKNEIEHFIDRCILRNEPPLSTMSDAADALRIIEAVERSYQHQRTELVQYD